MGNGEERGILVDEYPALLGVEEFRARLPLEGESEVGGGEIAAVELCKRGIVGLRDEGCTGRKIDDAEGTCRIGAVVELLLLAVCHGLVEECRCRFVAVMAEFPQGTDAVFPLLLVEEAEVFVVHHVVYLRPFEGHEDIVLVGGEMHVGGRHHIVGIREGEIPDGIFARQVFLLVERVGHFSASLPFLVLEAICHIALEEKMR